MTCQQPRRILLLLLLLRVNHACADQEQHEPTIEQRQHPYYIHFLSAGQPLKRGKHAWKEDMISCALEAAGVL